MRIITLIVSLSFLNQVTYAQDIEKVIPAITSLSNFQNLRDFTISSKGEEAYITVQSPLAEVSVIVQIKKNTKAWSEPSIVAFSGKYNDLEPFLSPDNLRLYFVSNRPLIDSGSKQPKDYDIWYVERKETYSEWGIPINIGSPINTGGDEFYPTVSTNNNLYFTSDSINSKDKDDIFYSVWKNGTYSKPINLGDSINTNGYEFNSYISPDESYLIYSGYNRKDGLGSGDLYISFMNNTHHWSKAINLGKEINSKYMDYCPFVDSNSGILYFTSKRSSFEKHNDFDSMASLIKEISKNKNGLSRIYKVVIDIKQLLKTTKP